MNLDVKAKTAQIEELLFNHIDKCNSVLKAYSGTKGDYYVGALNAKSQALTALVALKNGG